MASGQEQMRRCRGQVQGDQEGLRDPLRCQQALHLRHANANHSLFDRRRRLLIFVNYGHLTVHAQQVVQLHRVQNDRRLKIVVVVGSSALPSQRLPHKRLQVVQLLGHVQQHVRQLVLAIAVVGSGNDNDDEHDDDDSIERTRRRLDKGRTQVLLSEQLLRTVQELLQQQHARAEHARILLRKYLQWQQQQRLRLV